MSLNSEKYASLNSEKYASLNYGEYASLNYGEYACLNEGKKGNNSVLVSTQPCMPQDKARYRVDLLALFPWLRTITRSSLWPEVFNMRIVAPVFAAVVALLFLGPQDRDHNFALNVVCLVVGNVL